MSTAAEPSKQQSESEPESTKASREVVLENAANEIIVAVVGHVGSGTSSVARALGALLETDGLKGGKYEVEILKAKQEIEDWANSTGEPLPTSGSDDLNTTTGFQDLGDEMRRRSKDASAVARSLIKRIRMVRSEKTGHAIEGENAIHPDGVRRAYILDAIRNPAEVHLLRHVYQEAFVLVGVVCDEKVRLTRLTAKYKNAGKADAEDLMKRDAKDVSPYGQRVTDAFHLSDFFIDNTESRFNDDGEANPDWDVNDYLSRLVKIMDHSEVVRPSTEETAMHHAFSAALRSACLSRQVGAALVDRNGNVVATGTNEVPEAGGGVYGEAFDTDLNAHAKDHRCAYRITPDEPPFCSSTREQNRLVDRLIEDIPELRNASKLRKLALAREIRESGVGDLLEFSRAVHAEMDALLSAARENVTTIGTRLFVTTFPCHYCARHIVTAGVDEVRYIEPYPKSRAADLHPDSIQMRAEGWKPPSEGGNKVLFRPFVGVAPRMYRRAFTKDRELKDKFHGHFQLGEPDWGTPWHLRAVGYSELEAKLAADS